MPPEHRAPRLVSLFFPASADFLSLTKSSAVFQAGGLVVVLVEVGRKAYLASVVPVIVNAILGEHQLVVDIVAFVGKGDFPRSRLGEKQRGKILASWVTRKLRTIAQFSIRDGDGADSQITEVAEPRSGLGSVIGVGSSLKNVETVSSPPAHEHLAQDYTTLPTGISEMPTAYESSIVESPPGPLVDEDREDTPTEPRHYNNKYPTSYMNARDVPYADGQEDDGQPHPYQRTSPIPPQLRPHLPTSTSSNAPERYSDYAAYDPDHETSADPTPPDASHASFNFATDDDDPPPQAPYSSKPILSLSHQQDPSYSNAMSEPNEGDLWTLPSSNRQSSYDLTAPHQNGHPTADFRAVETGGSGGSSSSNARKPSRSHSEEQNDWPQEAIMHMNLARDGSSRGGTRYHGIDDHGTAGYDGSGYGHAL